MPTSATVQTNQFHIPKRRIKVRIELLTGGTLTGSFYADQHNSSGGPGRVSDRLNNREEPFIPLAVEDRHILVRKAVIATVQLENEPWETPQQSSNTSELRLRVKLTNGSSARGKIVAVLPKERARVLDFLNCYDAEFLALISGENRITLVNSNHIESVTEFVEPMT